MTTAQTLPVPETSEPGPPWPTKIVVLLREGLLPWQELNVTAFLAGAVAAAIPELIGCPYEDADGTRYLATIRQPVRVMTGPADVLARARERAVQRGLPTSVFTADLFATGGDVENRAAVRAVRAADLDLVGLALHGPKNAVDKVVKGARMHP
ncbi:DUF2000 family protein [Blastococcus sp. SYSU DS0619]